MATQTLRVPFDREESNERKDKRITMAQLELSSTTSATGYYYRQAGWKTKYSYVAIGDFHRIFIYT